jgi:hypothetical protein
MFYSAVYIHSVYFLGMPGLDISKHRQINGIIDFFKRDNLNPILNPNFTVWAFKLYSNIYT